MVVKNNGPYDYKNIKLELEGLLGTYWLTNLSNTAALLYHTLPQINWCGFYLDSGKELVLGPFQGKIACTNIAYGKGVCGTAFSKKQSLVVPDVHDFPGHIACDADSRSEIVIPLILQNRVLGVLDIDAPILNRFTNQDAKEIQFLAEQLVKKTEWPESF